MSDFHALERTEGRLRIVLHIPVPDVNNRVGKKVRDIVKATSKPSVLPDIDASEATALSQGRLMEHDTTIGIRGMDEERIQREIEKVYDRRKQVAVDAFRRKYDWWGAEGSVG